MRQDEGVVRVILASDAHPRLGYDLARYVDRAFQHDLFDSETSSLDLEHPFEVELEKRETPLFQKVKIPLDYFRLVAGVPSTTLRFDFDDDEGISFTSNLMNNALAYVDYDGVEGPLERLEEWLESFPDDLEALRAAADDSYPELLNALWLDYFDSQFDYATDVLEEHRIVHCVGPHDKGYVSDKMYFLLERQIYDQLFIPPSFMGYIN